MFFQQASALPIIKVALIDQLMSQKLSSVDYSNDYLKGINTAISLLYSQLGIVIKFKYFSYDKNDHLGPISMSNEVKSWHPDFIIGPRFSTNFLLLAPYYNNILVASPLASSEAVYKMPGNFYTLSFSDQYMGAILANFALRHFKNSKGAIIVDTAECLSCHAMGEAIMKYYSLHAKDKKIVRNSFIGNNVETTNIQALIKDWKQSYIIFTPNISYVSGILITRIANQLLKKNLIFLGGDEWGSHEVGYIGKLKTAYPYLAYHLENWYPECEKENYSLFQKKYFSIYHKLPCDPISYTSFHTLYSIISLIKPNALDNRKNFRAYLLNKFLEAKNKNGNIFRQNCFAIYYWNHKLDNDILIDKPSI